MVWLRRMAIALLGRYGAQLRFPHLLLLSAALLLVDLVVPDGIPFFDEVVLAVATLLFASWKQRRGSPGEGGALEASHPSGLEVASETRPDP